jgi:acetate kinase
MGIEAIQELIPGIPNVGVFDTAFHQTMAPAAYIYPIPYEYYEKYKVRRYGFHGTSHRYVAQRAAVMLDRPLSELKLISCHLGNGASVTAIEGGKSIATSMGFTPLEGLIMGTRCGDIDPAIIAFIMDKENLTIEQVNDILNKKSGVLGISGVSSDFRDIEEAAAKGNQRAILALEAYDDRVKRYIAAYAASMGGVDAVIFTAGVGENSASNRSNICEDMSFMGIKVCADLNETRGKEAFINDEDSKVKVLVIPTNEELMIARDTVEIVNAL